MTNTKYTARITLLRSDLAKIKRLIEASERKGVTLRWIDFEIDGEIKKGPKYFRHFVADSRTIATMTELKNGEITTEYNYQFKATDDVDLNENNLTSINQTFNRQ